MAASVGGNNFHTWVKSGTSQHVPVNARPFLAATDSFSGAANGNPQTVTNADIAFTAFSLQVTCQTSSSGASWAVVIEGSLDGVTYSEILRHSNAIGDTSGKTVGIAATFPVRFFRARCVSYTAGSATGLTVQSLAA